MFGEFKFVNGDFYRGHFIDDFMQHKGVLTLKDGTIYKGTFVDGLFHGNGK